eukprot:3220545-Amphidinium_carterae.1
MRCISHSLLDQTFTKQVHGAAEAACADLGSSSRPVPFSSASLKQQVPVSFVQSRTNQCHEGFRCVSRVARFGLGHFGTVDLKQTERVQAITDPEVSNRMQNLYEWNCPSDGAWTINRFETGSRFDQCESEGDCMCVPMGTSPDSATAIVGGAEELMGTKKGVRVETDCSKPSEIPKTGTTHAVLIPHYGMRLLPDGFDALDPNSDMGNFVETHHADWAKKYALGAERMQFALDSLHKWVVDVHQSNIQGKSPEEICTAFPGNALRGARAKLRRIQTLSQE